MKHDGNAARRGFTLIELLVVIAIIGILCGILIPMVSGMLGTAKDSQATDQCTQVADAWINLATQAKRFPDGDFLVSAAGSGGKLEGGDVWIRMTPAACCLVSFWKRKSPLPKADASNYSAKCGPNEYPYRETVEGYGAYSFDCDTWQKCFGFYAPWCLNVINSIVADQGAQDPDGAHDAIVEAFKTDKGTADGVHYGHGIVCVAIDANNDGKLVVPGSMIGQSDDVQLRSGAAAWVWNENRTKVLHSW